MSTEFPAAFHDLLDAQFATLATVGSDGGPQLTEVWFLFEHGKVKLSLNDSRLKTKNLRARPQCSLFILDLANPFRYLDVRGTAVLSPTTITSSPTGWAPSTAVPTCVSTTVRTIAGSW